MLGPSGQDRTVPARDRAAFNQPTRRRPGQHVTCSIRIRVTAAFGLSSDPVLALQQYETAARRPALAMARKQSCIPPVISARPLRHMVSADSTRWDRHVGYSALDDRGACRVLPLVRLIADVAVFRRGRGTACSAEGKNSRRDHIVGLPLSDPACRSIEALPTTAKWRLSRGRGPLKKTHFSTHARFPCRGLSLNCRAGRSIADVQRLRKSRQLCAREPSGVRLISARR
jgi:hypothetical protein